MSTSRGIPFSAPMVRALLAGTKTQTRRTVKLPENLHPDFGTRAPLMLALDDEGLDLYLHSRALSKAIRCPYGPPGAGLWVREAWKAHTTFDHLPPREIPQSNVWYMADDGYKAESRYRQAMFMPRWASRISLQITDVRVERLQDISAADCWAEGVPGRPPLGVHIESLGEIARWSDGVMREHPQPAYRALWESINGAGSWASNPWVWVVCFKRIEAGA